MGYTHYTYTRKTGIPVAAWEKICADVRTLLNNLPEGLALLREYDEPGTSPEVTANLIRFNGSGDLGHETFYFERVPQSAADKFDGTVFSFTKTARKPYDLVVCAALIVIHCHAYKYVSVSSDGGRDEWRSAVEWVHEVLGTFYPLPTGVWTDAGYPPDPTAHDSSADDGFTHETESNYAAIGNATPESEETPAAEPVPEPVTTSHAFIVDVREFRAALEVAVCKKKPTIPTIGNVLLSPTGSTLRVLSTDLDKWTSTEVPAMIDEGAGNILLPHRKALDLLKGETGILKITATIVTLSDRFLRASVKLEVGGYEYVIDSLNPASFPDAPVVPAVGFDLPGTDLKAALGRIIGSVSTEESRYTINGALMECSTNKLVLVATDGHRLALDSVPMRETRTGKAVVHREALAWLYKHASGDVVVTFEGEHSFFHVGPHVLICRNASGNFPNWQAVTPRKNSFEHEATFDSADHLAKILAKVARMADDRSGCVKFLINGACVLSASSIDHGSATASVSASVKHYLEAVREIAVGFNSEYVLEVLKIAGKNPVVLSLKDHSSAGVFTIPSIPDFQCVIMPMRI